uniref:Uncharacterized protein n=1 Tax=Oryza rufipogon TaxID=4529 RepID=A0A0E0Q176_ORYRU
MGNIIRLTGAMLIGKPYGRNNARLRPAEFEESWPAPCLPTTDVLDSPSVPATASQLCVSVFVYWDLRMGTMIQMAHLAWKMKLYINIINNKSMMYLLENNADFVHLNEPQDVEKLFVS